MTRRKVGKVIRPVRVHALLADHQNSDALSAEERAVLRYAGAMTVTPVEVPGPLPAWRGHPCP